MAQLTYNPAVFSVPSERAAREIILTREGGQTTDERWVKETPHLGELLSAKLGLSSGDVVIDFGCGIGRVARELILRTKCQVLGVDLSQEMRGFAPGYVDSANFSVVSPEVFRGLVDRGFKADAAISVWVLQHCLNPAADLDLLKRSLTPSGAFGVVNNNDRAVPTKEKAWARDSIDVRELLNGRFAEVESGRLDPTIVTEHLSKNTYWALYRA